MRGDNEHITLDESQDVAIAYIPLSRFTWRISLKRVLAVTLILPPIMYFWVLFLNVNVGMFFSAAPVVFVMILIAIVITGSSHVRRSEHIDLQPSGNPLARIMAALQARLPYAYWSKLHWTWPEFVELFNAAELSPPRTISDERLRDRLDQIELPEVMLEPEPILPSMPFQRRTGWAFIGLYVAYMLLYVWMGQLLFAVIFAAIGIFFALSLPQIRDLFRNVRMDDGNIIAGMGSLLDKKGRRWTIDDAVMLVQTTRGKPPMFVSFIGHAGHLLITFTDETDPDFIKLWQRWNHPHPRPELRVE